jgi:hypothetical protein
MSTKSHAHTRCETLRKSSISTREYAEIHIQRPFFVFQFALKTAVLERFFVKHIQETSRVKDGCILMILPPKFILRMIE